MAKTTKKETSVKDAKPTQWKITKNNDKVIYRKEMSDVKKARMVKKGWKVEEV
tara:strand:+ start:359 stop:517 length:159 start_codon:yes stop_codon:yes gene_type:complete